jgi:hypothetical protein
MVKRSKPEKTQNGLRFNGRVATNRYVTRRMHRAKPKYLEEDTQKKKRTKYHLVLLFQRVIKIDNAFIKPAK